MGGAPAARAPAGGGHRRLAVVTGATRGFGLEVARTLATRDWQVVTVARRESPELAQLPDVTQVLGDVVDVPLEAVTEAVGDRPLDLLVNNAGAGGTGRTLQTATPDELERTFAVHVVGPARLAGALLPLLARAEHPLVVNVSSRLASLTRQADGTYRDLPTSYAYRIAKAAQNMLTICMAAEQGAAIRVWALHPGRLRTDMGMAGADLDPAVAADRLLELVEQGDAASPAFLSLEDEGTLPW